MISRSGDEPFPPTPTPREERLQLVLRELERRFGPWIVYRLKDARPRTSTPAISSGSLALDLITGIGGFPRGRISELVGPPSSGKSTLTFHLLANAQRQRGFVTFIDTAHRASFEQMHRCGVDLHDLFLVVPESIPEALDVAALLIESGGLDALVVGPLADLIGYSLPRGQEAARRLARLNAAMSGSPTALVFLTDLARLSPPSWERALRHFASLRIAATPVRPLLHPSGDITGLRIRLETMKNKLAPAGRQAEIDLLRERGVHAAAELIDLGLAHALLSEHPLGICYGQRLLGRGRGRAIAALEQDPALAAELRTRIFEALRSAPERWSGILKPTRDPAQGTEIKR